jgi:hypothetical protein
MALFGFLRPNRKLVEQVQALDARLATLEAQQHPTKLMEWIDLQERLSRYLARISAVEGRLKQREEAPEKGKADPVTLAVLRSKFPQANGG